MAAPDASKRLPPILAALGVVFGDIGTSPLYAFKEAFSEGRLSAEPEAVLAVLSMIFWAVTLVVSLKYVSVVIRFDSRGEGGVLALMARALASARGRNRLSWLIGTLGVFAASLFLAMRSSRPPYRCFQRSKESRLPRRRSTTGWCQRR